MLAKHLEGVSFVSIGGGTGLSTLLAGLKEYVGKESSIPDWIDVLTAVVTVTDDGGSSGRLREEFQMLAPGDIRNCIAALAEDQHLLTKLLRYRFESGGELSGHSIGNIVLTALTDITGDFLEAIKAISEVLAIKGRIFPSTMENATLAARLSDGRTITGESKITAARSHIEKLWLSPTHCKPLPETLEAIKEAKVITIGPGSLYTSIMPNLLVDGIVEAISNSAAMKVYICNIMTQPGETEGFSGEDHIGALLEYSPDFKLDYILVNTRPISDELRDKYLADGSVEVRFTAEGEARLTKAGYKIVHGDFLNENGLVRHDSQKLARVIMDLYLTDIFGMPRFEISEIPHIELRVQTP
jgi:uncharacterized cofD-like protein